jgi:tetratricopeptide (TPR) repeat protein
MRQAAQIDPVSPSVQTSLAWAFYLLRQNQQTADQCKRVLDLYPDYIPAHQLLGLTYDQMHSDQLAIAELKRAEALESGNTMTPVFLDYALARSGRVTEASRNLADIDARSGGSFIPDYLMAAAWVAIGDKQKAEDFLDRALQSRSNWIIYLHLDPRFDNLRADERFQAILQRIGPAPSEAQTAQR